MKSILQQDKECLICSTTLDLHKHHVFYGTANRKKSEQYGMTVWLCGRHHNMSTDGIHFVRELDIAVKREAQKVFEREIGTREFFIQEFGKNYLED